MCIMTSGHSFPAEKECKNRATSFVMRLLLKCTSLKWNRSNPMTRGLCTASGTLWIYARQSCINVASMIEQRQMTIADLDGLLPG